MTGCHHRAVSSVGWKGDATTDTLAVSSPLKEQSLRLPLSLCLRLFLALAEMRDDPPLWQWQAQVGDAIARGGNIDKKNTKSAQSRATGNRRNAKVKRKYETRVH